MRMTWKSPTIIELVKTKKLPPVHPGEVLLHDFMEPLSLSQYALAKAIGVTAMRISQIVRGQRGITADTALRFARCFGTRAAWWLDLRWRDGQHDLAPRCSPLCQQAQLQDRGREKP